jgi:uncharacterized protein involved in exopolysaccharide biosynthesis
MPKYELNIRDYLRILRKRRVVIITTFLIVVVGTAIYLSGQPVVYQTSTTIKIEERKTVAGVLTEWILYSPADIMESTTKLIKGYEVMRQSAIRLGMITESSPQDKVNDAVGELQGSVSTSQEGQTNMIRITATTDTAKGAMAMANTVAEVYIDENLKDKAKQARQARQFIEEQLRELDNRLKSAEDKMKGFGDETKRVRLAEPIEKQLTDLQFALAGAMQKYTDKHPTVIQLRAQIQEMQKHTTGYTEGELEYAGLMRESDANKKLYAMLREKLEEARIAEAQKVSDISVVDPAFMPGAPISTNKRLAIVVGIIMGVVLGASLAFVIETLDTSINTIEDVESMVKLRVLGLVPPVGRTAIKRGGMLWSLVDRLFPAKEGVPKDKQEPIYLIAHFDPASTSAEAYRNIQTNLKLDPAQKTQLLEIHASQVGRTRVKNLTIIESSRSCANFRGFQGRVKYAEGFKALRLLREIR